MATFSLASHSFRLEHAEFKQLFGHLDAMVGALATASPHEQAAHMARVVAFLTDHLKGHAEWEERVLYRVVDREAGGREPFTAAPFTTITSYLSWDHERFDHTLAGVREDVQGERMDEARHALDEYARGLERHMRIEEEVVFPVFDARSGMSGGPTAVMRDEHRSIRIALAMMRDGLDRSDAQGFHAGLRFLRTILPEHNAKEEHILYPTTDRLLTPAERTTLTRRLERE